MKFSTMFLGQKVLVTGASGFIGSHLCRRLCEEGAEVTALSREKRSNSQKGIRWCQGDLSSISAVRNLLADIEPSLIIHLAGYPVGSRAIDHILPSFACNLMSTVHLLMSASEAGCKRMIITGSMEEPDHESGADAVPCSPYAASKWASSSYARMFHALYQLPVVILRTFMVYGPGQDDLTKLVPYAILSLMRGKSPEITSGQRLVDWIYVTDVVEGFLAAAQASDIEGKTIDIGSGELTSVHSIVERLVRLVDPTIAPDFEARRNRQNEQERVADVTRSQALLGWKPKIQLDEGLKSAVGWYKLKYQGDAS